MKWQSFVVKNGTPHQVKATNIICDLAAVRPIIMGHVSNVAACVFFQKTGHTAHNTHASDISNGHNTPSGFPVTENGY